MARKKTKKNAKKRFIIAFILIMCLMLLGCLLTYTLMQEDNATAPQSNNNDNIDLIIEENPDVIEQINQEDNVYNFEDISLEDLEIPICAASTGNTDHEIHKYMGFTLCYRESYELAEWVSYTLTKEELNRVIGRTDDFRTDKNISTGSATPSDYKGSGFDRGHLAPAADMEWSEQSARESLLMSNMTPQAPALNRKMWKTLEEQVRIWAESFGQVTVITGPLLEKSADNYDSIGTNKVAVPEYFYKILATKLLDNEGNTNIISIAFIMPNNDCAGNIWDYVVTIDEVEERTGLNFFAIIPDEKEALIEGNIDTQGWK